MDMPMNGLKTFARKGTQFVHLLALSDQEGHPMYAQVRKLTGKDLGLFLKNQTQLQSLHSLEKDWATLPPEHRHTAVVQALLTTRDIVLGAVLRVIELNEEKTVSFTLTSSPIGEHGETEISVDCLESDYTLLLTKITTVSLSVGGPSADGPFRGHSSGGDSGLSGEEVRTVAE